MFRGMMQGREQTGFSNDAMGAFWIKRCVLFMWKKTMGHSWKNQISRCKISASGFWFVRRETKLGAGIISILMCMRDDLKIRV
jgi:hypothetical protein